MTARPETDTPSPDTPSPDAPSPDAIRHEYLADREGERLDVFLARRLPGLSRTAARRHIVKGLVFVEDEIERPSYRLRFGNTVGVWPAPPPQPVAEAEDIPLDVRYEDAEVIVVNKPPGLTVHPAPGEPRGTLVNALLARCPDLQAIGDAIRPGIVHRLDKDTSGVMMVAKQQSAMHELQEQIRARTVEKRYWAVVAGTPDPLSGKIDAPIGRDFADPRRMAVVEGGRPSQTEYEVRERFLDTSLLECRLISGRTHQIRVHLTALGHPIIGDRIYGFPSDLIDRQALHARVLAFAHPRSGERIRIEVEPPPDFLALLDELRRIEPVHGPDIAPLATVTTPPDAPGWRPSRHRSRHVR